MQIIQIVVPFVVPHLAPFRKNEVVTVSKAEAEAWIKGGLARPYETKQPEFATGGPQKKK